MSAQPQPQPNDPKAKLQAIQRRRDRRDDGLYFAGVSVLSIGLGMLRPAFGVIAAGFFVLLLPALSIVSSFIRGLRPPTR